MEDDRQEIANGGNDSPQRKGWGRWLAIGGVALLALGGIGIAGAMSDGFGGYGMGGFGGPMRHMAMGAMGEHGIENMLEQVDATPDQETKLWAIIDAARAEIRPTARRCGYPRRSRDHQRATIDRAAAEKLRRAHRDPRRGVQEGDDGAARRGRRAARQRPLLEHFKAPIARPVVGASVVIRAQLKWRNRS